MKYLWIGVAVAAAAGALAWWLHERGQEDGVAAPPADSAAAPMPAGIDDGMLRRPPNPDPGMLRRPSNPDPKMAVIMSQVHATPGASGNGREE